MSSRVHHARLVSVREIARDTLEFVLGHDDDLQFRPGQFVSIQVGLDEQKDPILRSYSIASPPERRGEIVLIVRMIETGIGSRFFRDLKVGDAVRFTGPMGFFVNELFHPGDVVYAATGTGIAPIVPMAQEVLRRHERGQVLLWWGMRCLKDLFWQDELAALVAANQRLTVSLCLSRPEGEELPKGALRGRVTAPLLAALPTLSHPVFYLCGNGHMIDEVKAALVAQGVQRKRQIRTEAFFDE